MESQVLLRRKIQESAYFDANKVSPSLFQSIGYRQRIALQLLENSNVEYQDQLMMLYDDANSRIKLLLGL